MPRNRRPKEDGAFWESATSNNRTFNMYYNQLLDMAINVFKYNNLPDEIDPRFIELKLISRGYTLFFRDEDMAGVDGSKGRYLCLPCAIGGTWNVYNVPIKRRAYATNGYQKNCTIDDSVIIYNNYLRQPDLWVINQYANRLYDIQRTIDINVKAQKTPIALVTNDRTRLTMRQFYKNYDGNEPYITVDESFDLNGIKVINTESPYVASKLQDLKHEIFNECLTYFGISNINSVKKERMISDEVTRNLGGTEVERNVRLNARQDAIDKINKMFGLNIEVEYNSQLDLVVDSTHAFDSTVDEQERGEDDE